MYVGNDFSVATPDEERRYTFDFTNDLSSGETVQSSEWELSVHTGEDADVSDHMIGDPIDSSPYSSHRIGGLVNGVTYLVRCLVTTNNGSILELHSYIKCVEAS